MIFREKAKKKTERRRAFFNQNWLRVLCVHLEKKSVYQIDFSLCAAYINEEFVTFHLRSLTSK